LHHVRLLLLLFAITWNVQAAESDTVQLVLAGRYSALEQRFQSVQESFKRGDIDDEALLAAFRPFYDVEPPDLAARYDEWIAQFPKSYVAHLARGLYYKHLAYKAQDGRFTRDLGDDRFEKMRRARKLAATDFEESLSLDDRPLLSYMHAMDVSGDMSWRWPESRLFSKANEIAPKNFIARRKHLAGMRWRWTGGTVDQMREFVQECRDLGFTAEQMRELDNIIKEEQAWLAMHRSHNYAMAEKLYRDILSDEPDNMDVGAALAWLLVHRRECAEAISLATRVLAAQPDNSRTIGDRATCYFHTGQEQLGISEMHRGAELGDAWAQRELARYYWQGRLVPQDRGRALQLLRAAAVQGDAEAIREYERVTHQKIPARARRWPWGTLIKVGLGALAVFGLVSVLVSRFHRAPGPGQLRYPPGAMISGAMAFLFFSFIALVSSIYGNQTATMWTSLVFMGMAAMGLYRMANYIFTRYEFTTDGICRRRLIGQPIHLPWDDITSVDYRDRAGKLVLKSATGQSVRIPLQLLGLPAFAQAVLDRVPFTAIDDDTRMVLSAVAGDGLEENDGR
jgi:tetratricopeptide (TPR) repeat protein